MKRWLTAIVMGACGGAGSTDDPSGAGTGASSSEGDSAHDDSIGDGDGDDGTGDDAGDDADDGGGEACPGVALLEDGALTVDLASVSLALSLQLDDAPLPDATLERGAIVVQPAHGGAPVSLPLGTTGAFATTVTLSPGRYDVRYEANSQWCDRPDEAFPCGDGILAEDLLVATDAAIDLHLTTARLTGEVTSNGISGATGPRGALSFTSNSDDNGAGAVVPISSEDTATYGVRLVRGSYDVGYAGAAEACDGQTTPGWPCNAGPLLEAVEVQQDASLTVDVPSVRLSGVVTVDGATMAAQSLDRGSVSLARGESEDSPFTVASLGPAGDAEFAATVLTGTYDVRFEANPALCDDGPAPPVPCSGGRVRAGVELQQDAALDLDLTTVELAVQIRRDGAALPSSQSPRGAVTLSPVSGGTAASISLGTEGEVSRDLRLLSGEYHLAYAPGDRACPSDPPMPCVGGSLAQLPLVSDGALEIDVPLVRVTGQVTLAGRPLTADEGALSFAPADEAFGAVVVPLTGADYTVGLLPGSYGVQFVPNPSHCADAPGDDLPCAAPPPSEPSMFLEDGAYDLDLEPIRVAVQTRLDGSALPSIAVQRGSLRFDAGLGGTPYERPLGASGPADFELVLLAGHYVVSHLANAQLCDPAAETSGIPCTGGPLLGCDDP